MAQHKASIGLKSSVCWGTGDQAVNQAEYAAADRDETTADKMASAPGILSNPGEHVDEKIREHLQELHVFDNGSSYIMAYSSLQQNITVLLYPKWN